MAQQVKNESAMQEKQGTWVLIPGSGKSPGKGNGNSFQYSCLKNPMDRGHLAGYSPKGQTPPSDHTQD